MVYSIQMDYQAEPNIVFYAEIVMDSTKWNSERKDTHVSFHKAKISETFDKNPSSVDLSLTPVFSRFRVAQYFVIC